MGVGGQGMTSRAVALVWALALLVAASGCTAGDETVPDVVSPVPSRLDAVPGPTVVAVGDIACDAGKAVTATKCRHAATARLARSYDPVALLALGDLQYEDGSLRQFRASYDLTWGDLKAVTRPVPGNHEYRTPRASGYYAYFRGRTPPHPGYYAFDVGSWRVYALNSNCHYLDCVAQLRWFERDMAVHRRRCTAVLTHHPRHSSGEHGSHGYLEPMWRAAHRHGTDLALAGHDHHYERFARIGASGEPTPDGILSFVAGTGGKSLYAIEDVLPGSAYRYNRTAGVLALRLGTGRFAWEFRTVGGMVVDAGARRCV